MGCTFISINQAEITLIQMQSLHPTHKTPYSKIGWLWKVKRWWYCQCHWMLCKKYAFSSCLFGPLDFVLRAVGTQALWASALDRDETCDEPTDRKDNSWSWMHVCDAGQYCWPTDKKGNTSISRVWNISMICWGFLCFAKLSSDGRFKSVSCLRNGHNQQLINNNHTSDAF